MAAPTYIAAGDAFTDATGDWGFSAPQYNFDAAVAVGDFLIMQIFQDGTTSDAVTIPAYGGQLPASLSGGNGWTFLGTWPVGDATAGYQHLYAGRSANAGTTGICATVGSNSTSEDVYVRAYAFRDVNAGSAVADVLENGTAGTMLNTAVNSASIFDVSVTKLGVDRLALNFIAVNDDNAIGEFTGESGGNWTFAVSPYAESSGTDGAIGLQIASITTGNIIDGGSASIVDIDAYGITGFALIGTTVTETPVFYGPTVEFNQAVMGSIRP